MRADCQCSTNEQIVSVEGFAFSVRPLRYFFPFVLVPVALPWYSSRTSTETTFDIGNNLDRKAQVIIPLAPPLAHLSKIAVVPIREHTQCRFLHQTSEVASVTQDRVS